MAAGERTPMKPAERPYAEWRRLDPARRGTGPRLGRHGLTPRAARLADPPGDDGCFRSDTSFHGVEVRNPGQAPGHGEVEDTAGALLAEDPHRLPVVVDEADLP